MGFSHLPPARLRQLHRQGLFQRRCRHEDIYWLDVLRRLDSCGGFRIREAACDGGQNG